MPVNSPHSTTTRPPRMAAQRIPAFMKLPNVLHPVGTSERPAKGLALSQVRRLESLGRWPVLAVACEPYVQLPLQQLP